MKKISALVFAFCIVMLCIPHYVTAQAYAVPGGDNYRQEGIASWYGAEFDGRPTASGEIFNASLYTAAHPTLPFGTHVLVTNRNNNQQIAVRINDRGPFVASRIIDVSRAAAEHLGMIITGTAPVVVEVVQVSQQRPAEPYSQPPAFTQVPVQPQPPAYVQAPVQPQQPPAYVQPPIQQPQTYTPPPAYAQPPVIVQPPIQQQPPTYVQPPIQQQPPAYTQPPAFTQVPVQPQPPAYTPPPVIYTPTPAPTEASQGPYSPVTVTVYPPAPPPQAPVLPAVTMPPFPVQEDLPPPVPGARLIPAAEIAPTKTYKLQIGSYKVARNAVETFEKLKNAGLNPAYEPHGEYYRVVIKGVNGSEVQSVTDKLGMAGFHEAVIREE